MRSISIRMGIGFGQILFLPLFAALFSGCAGMLKVGAIESIQKHYDRGNYEKAVWEADSAAGYCQDPLYQAELAFLKAQAFEKMGRIKEASELYRFLIEQCPSSHYSYQAKARLTMLTDNENPED